MLPFAISAVCAAARWRAVHRPALDTVQNAWSAFKNGCYGFLRGNSHPLPERAATGGFSADCSMVVSNTAMWSSVDRISASRNALGTSVCNSANRLRQAQRPTAVDQIEGRTLQRLLIGSRNYYPRPYHISPE